MKKYFFLLLLPLYGLSQKNDPLFFDINWKPCTVEKARYIAIVEKTDSGWLRYDYYLSTSNLQMSGLYADSACKTANGWFRYYYPEGNPSSYGRYENGRKQGTWLGFHNNGVMKDSSFYSNDSITGISLTWHSNGYLSDSMYRQDNGYIVNVGWFSNGTPSYAGRLIGKTMEGAWQFFHKNGKLAANEFYVHGKVTDSSYYDEEGMPVAKKIYETAFASFKGGDRGWKRYLENKLVFPNGYRLSNTDVITVVVEAIIDEDGNVADAWVQVPFKPPFDYEALRAFKRSPKWQPCTRHNRREVQFVRQPVTFAQTE